MKDYEKFVDEISDAKLITVKQRSKLLQYLKNTFVVLANKMKDDDEVDIHSATPQHLLAKILTHDASCEYGSGEWCISNSENSEHWETYVEDDDNVQYFLWTLKGDGSSNKYLKLVGFTLKHHTLEFMCCFDNNNKPVMPQTLLKILKVNKVDFKLKYDENFSYDRDPDEDEDDYDYDYDEDDYESGF